MVTEVVTIIIRERGGRATSRSIRRVGSVSRTAAASVRLLTGALAILGIGIGVRSLLRTADSATRMGNQIRLATNSTEEFNVVQKRLLKIANDTRSPLEATVKIYRRLSIATRDLGVSQEDVLTVTEGLNAAIAVSGATAQEGASGLIQLGQALASNRLQGDELRSVLENLPPLAQALADSLREIGGKGGDVRALEQISDEIMRTGEVSEVSIGRLRKLGEEGKLSTAVVWPALQEAVKRFNQQLNELPFTLEQASTVFSNTFIGAVGEINKTIGATEALSGGIVDLSNKLRAFLISVSLEFSLVIIELLKFGKEIRNILKETGLLDFTGAITASKSLRLVLLTIVVVLRTILGLFDLMILSGKAVFIGLALEALISRRITKKVFDDLVEDIKRSADLATKNAVSLGDALGGIKETIEKIVEESTTDPGEIPAPSINFDALITKAEEVSERLREILIGPLQGPDIPLTAEGEDKTPPDEVATKVTNALKAQVRLRNQLLLQTKRNIEPLTAELEKLKQQRAQLAELVKIGGDNNDTRQIALLLTNEEARVTGEITEGEANQVRLLEQIRSLSSQIRDTNAEFADNLEKAAAAAIAAGGGLEVVNRELGSISSRGVAQLQREQDNAENIGELIGEALASGLKGALSAVLRGEAINFSELLAETAGNLLEIALDQAIKSVGGALEGLLGGFGDKLGGALAGALGIGLSFAAGALRGSSQKVTTDLAQSAAVENVQATRGVVAGPTNIPIFQVGASLEDALVPTNAILSQILNAILTTGSVTDGGGGDSGPNSTFGAASPSLI